MPGLVAFNRRWNIGGDDFVLPAFFELLIRGAWLLAIVIVDLTHADHDNCPQARFFHLFITGEEICLAVICVVTTAIMVTSARGTIVDTEKRRHLPLLIYIRGLCEVVEVSWNIVGSVWLYQHQESKCERYDFAILVQFTVFCNWALLGLLLICIYIITDAMGSKKYSYRKGENDIEGNQDKVNWFALAPDERKGKMLLSTWKSRMKLAFCCVPRSEVNEAYVEVAKAWATLFEDKDVVASDILMGIIVLARKQAEEIESLKAAAGHSELPYHSARKDAITLRKDTGHPWMNFRQIHHYFKYANGMYGWLNYTAEHWVPGCFRMWKHMKCCACCVTSSKRYSCDYAAFKEVTRVKDEDVIYITFCNRVYLAPFAVILDHETKSVVVCIRGSLSMRDVLTDMTGHCELVTGPGLPEQFYCHLGMLNTAKNVQRQLVEKACLTKAFERQPTYSLVTTGHSLGGGVAAILAMMLRPKYPDIKCFTYGTPGIMSPEAAKFTEDFVISVVYGDDCCPTLNMWTVNEVNNKIFALLSECKEPKYKVLLGGTRWCCQCKSSPVQPSKEDSDEVKHPIPVITIDPPPLEDSKTVWRTSSGSLGSQCACSVPQYAPGRIIHITRLKERFKYQAHWVKPSFFREIRFRPKMVIHHLPHLMEKILSRIEQQLDPPVTKIINPPDVTDSYPEPSSPVSTHF